MTEPRRYSRIGRIPLYALISLAAYVCCLIVLILLLVNADKLTRLDLTEHVYYLALVPMASAAAVLLFGVLLSSATYEGTFLGGTLKLGGPIVCVALVAVGYHFVPKTSTFPLTVYVHGEGGPQDIVLRNSGRVLLELGPERRVEPIGENGQAYFPAIPANFRGQEVPAWVESDTYESVDPRAKQRLSGTALHFVVQKKILHYQLGGTVSDPDGNPLADVRIVLPQFHAEGRTNDQGAFEFNVVAESQRIVELVAQKQGYRTVHLSPTLGDPGFNFSLKRTW